MNDPIAHLLREHRVVMAELAPLRSALEKVEREGDPALPAAHAALESAGQMMASTLLRHARKEDEVLFPALEAAFGAGLPTSVMREEHRAIHERAARFRETLRQLREIEHPAIVTGGAAIRQLTRTTAGAEELREIGRDILERIDMHFAKEEEILFPMAAGMLSPSEEAEITRRMERIDAEPVS